MWTIISIVVIKLLVVFQRCSNTVCFFFKKNKKQNKRQRNYTIFLFFYLFIYLFFFFLKQTEKKPPQQQQPTTLPRKTGTYVNSQPYAEVSMKISALAKFGTEKPPYRASNFTLLCDCHVFDGGITSFFEKQRIA
jgi:hypothetical protein